MLQSISSVFVVYRRKTLTGSPDPTPANGTDKPCIWSLNCLENNREIKFTKPQLYGYFCQISHWTHKLKNLNFAIFRFRYRKFIFADIWEKDQNIYVRKQTTKMNRFLYTLPENSILLNSFHERNPIQSKYE